MGRCGVTLKIQVKDAAGQTAWPQLGCGDDSGPIVSVVAGATGRMEVNCHQGQQAAGRIHGGPGYGAVAQPHRKICLRMSVAPGPSPKTSFH